MTVGVLNVGGIYSLIDVTIHDSINKHWWDQQKERPKQRQAQTFRHEVKVNENNHITLACSLQSNSYLLNKWLIRFSFKVTLSHIPQIYFEITQSWYSDFIKADFSCQSSSLQTRRVSGLAKEMGAWPRMDQYPRSRRPFSEECADKWSIWMWKTQTQTDAPLWDSSLLPVHSGISAFQTWSRASSVY